MSGAITISWGKALSSDPDGWLRVWRGTGSTHPLWGDAIVHPLDDLAGKWDTDGVAQVSVEVEPPFTIRAMGLATCQWFSMTVQPDDVVDGHVHIRPSCEMTTCGDCSQCDAAPTKKGVFRGP